MNATEVSARWTTPQVVAGFSTSGPNEVLLDFAASLPQRGTCLDIGCGAARNSIPLAMLGYQVVGIDLSMPMIAAARQRVSGAGGNLPLSFVHGPMAPLPFANGSFDLIVAHGVWNLATSDEAFRSAVAEAARVARPGAALFLFTFSRTTIPSGVAADAGQRYTFSWWNGEPQCFLTAVEIVSELAAAGFTMAPGAGLSEYNRPDSGGHDSELPVLYEGCFRRMAGHARAAGASAAVA